MISCRMSVKRVLGVKTRDGDCQLKHLRQYFDKLKQ